MKEYFLACNTNLTEFHNEVNGMLRQGWRLRGPLKLIKRNGDLVGKYQAMVRDIPEPKSEAGQERVIDIA